jgi:hypothetical protein
LNQVTENQKQDHSTCENNDGNLVDVEKEKNAGKSNSELMAEFFAVVSDEDKKE